MKGIVFKQFLNMIESEHGYTTVDKLIENSDLESKGAYTSVGTYHYTEIIRLVSSLSTLTKIPIDSIIKKFGKSLIPVFSKAYPDFFITKDIFTFLASLNDYVHVEVQKLYPDAELPTFTVHEQSSNHIVIEYNSSRPFANLAEGLILGSIKHFKENIKLETSQMNNTNRQRLFRLTREQ